MKIHIWYIVIAFIVASCDSPQLVESWKNPTITTYTPTKVFVVGLTSNLEARQKFETELKNALEIRGIEAIRSLDVPEVSFKSQEMTKIEMDDLETILLKDSLGNDIKIDKIIDVRAQFVEVIQTKSAQVIADVVYTDLKQNRIIDTFTIDSGFVFENVFGRFKGDERALDATDRTLVRQVQIGFPSDEQMVYDTGEDLKLKLKQIISSFKLNS